jgi:PAS domain S-box-containing protein
MKRIFEKLDDKREERRSHLLADPQFWSIVSIFILISLHYYDNLTTFRLFSLPDLPLGITRHTVDRVLYLIPIALSSLVFGLRGGLVTVGAASAAMLPRALFFSPFENAALLETIVVTLIGGLVPLGSAHYRDQEEQLEVTKGKLELSERKYRQLFESAHDAIWVQDLSGKVIAANQATAELLGYDLQALIGMDSRQFFLQGDLITSKATQEHLLSSDGRHQPYRQIIVKKDGSKAYIMLTTNSILSNGHPAGIQLIGRDITKEVRMQENQGFYLRQITRAHEEERQRISRDLHDSTAQSLIATIRSLERFYEEDAELSPERLKLLYSYKMQLKDVLQEIRQISRDLRPAIMDELGLIAAVEWLVGQVKVEHGITAHLMVLGEEREFSPEIEVTLFRIIQEALRNIVRHAEATMAHIAIEFTDVETRVTISDNGKGLELPENLGELSRVGKLGIDGMQTRARLVGGTFDVRSELGKGTIIIITCPC